MKAGSASAVKIAKICLNDTKIILSLYKTE